MSNTMPIPTRLSAAVLALGLLGGALPAAAVSVNPGLNDTQLANALAPVMQFAGGETRFPISIESFYQHSVLKDKFGNILKSYPKTVTEMTTVTGTNLGNKDDYYLDIDASADGANYDGNAPIYAHVVKYSKNGVNYREAQFAALYGYNDCEMFRSHSKKFVWDKMSKYNFAWCNFGRHPGDWEHMSVRINAATGEVTDVYMNAHGKQQRLAPKDVTWVNNRPKVYVAQNSHGTHPGTEFYSSSTIIDSDWSWASSGFATPAGLYSLKVGDLTDNNGKTWDTSGKVRMLATADGSSPTNPITEFPGRWGRINVDNTNVQSPRGNVPHVKDGDMVGLATFIFKASPLLNDYKTGTGPSGPWQTGWWDGEDN
ncbi:DUF946 domain-containing protein [Chitinimonas arctica]|uniref:DUF946 domain-containing protein n=1 Tax=Chitinimonas arctica TaxID=2594795 RepID=A0A516SLC7_9NEIS|nr:Vps62-related protein [Chitinimonas arctica]QDQ28962.1 DUF946 domain-containing protein [Chitinimonas arctica]